MLQANLLFTTFLLTPSQLSGLSFFVNVMTHLTKDALHLLRDNNISTY